MDRKETMWCTVCGARFTEEEIQGWGCPKCGNQGVPCGCDGDVRVEINWHELHTLCVWAENWAQQCAKKDPKDQALPKIVTAIAYRLQQQFPELGQLTLSGELAQLPVKLTEHGMGITGVTVEHNVPRLPPVPVNGPGARGHARDANSTGRGHA